MHPEEELLVWGGAIRGFEARLFPKIEGGELTWVKPLVTLPLLFPESRRLLGGIIAGLWPLPSSVTSLQTEPCQEGQVAAAHPRLTWLSCSDMGSPGLRGVHTGKSHEFTLVSGFAVRTSDAELGLLCSISPN